MEKNIIKNNWHPGKRMLMSQLSGNISSEEIEIWETSLNSSLEEIEANSHFKIFINLVGFTAIDLTAHKRFRTIIPNALAEYNWKVGYVNLFENEANSMNLRSARGISCIAAAHSHHDESKMQLYENRFGKYNERFFTDSVLAENWLKQFKI